MGATTNGGGNPPPVVSDDQTGGTPTTPPITEPPETPASDAFTDVSRESLNEDQQKRYDEMQADYTRKTQLIADRGRQMDAEHSLAEIGRLVEDNPIINDVVWSTVEQLKAGNPPDNQITQPPPATQTQADPNMSPEEVAGRAMIREEVLTVMNPLAEVVNKLAQSVGGVTSYMQDNQANAEYAALCTKFPAAKSLTPQQIQATQMRYKTAAGTPIPMQDAFVLMAANNPAMLTATPSTPPSGGTPPAEGTPPAGGGGIPPSTERGGDRGTGGGADTSFKPGTTRFKQLQDAAAALDKAGVGGIAHAINRARAKFDQAHPTP